MKRFEKVKYLYLSMLVKKSGFFDEEWYRKQSGIAPEKNAAFHYVSGGWRKWNPSERFDHESYWEVNLDVRKTDICPLVHYLLFGKKEGRRIKAGENVYRAQKYYACTFWRGLKRSIGAKFCRKLIEKNKSARILVSLQMFYPESWDEIHEYLKNLKDYTFDLVITYQKDLPFADVLPQMKAAYPKARLIEVGNIGFDLGAFHTSIRGMNLDNYDIIFKIHSKGIRRKRLYMYKQLFKKRDWFLYLYEGVLGAGNVHKVIDLLLSNAHCGMVAAENLLVHDPKHKQNLVRQSLKEHGIDCDIPQDYRYVAGTCFAVRAELMKHFQQQDLPFLVSRRGRFSLAHCVERTLCFPAQMDGYELMGTEVCRLRRMLRRIQSWNERNTVKDELLKDERFILDDEFVYRSIEPRRIKKYEIVNLRLCEIKRRWFDGKIYSLTECAPYKYLQGDKSAYEEYREFHETHNLPAMNEERFGSLIESIENKGFNEKYIIVVNQDNIVIDGQHRSCILLNRFGADYEIKVLKIYYDNQLLTKGLAYLREHGIASAAFKTKQYLKLNKR